jgi:plasmid maintenance system killer protein
MGDLAAVLDRQGRTGHRRHRRGGLETLKGDLKGLHSIRVNDQWRLVFRWQGNDAHQVRLMDYH